MQSTETTFAGLGLDHFIFDGEGGGGCGNPPNNIEHVLLVKKKYHAEFLRREKITGSRNQGVAKDFLRDT